MKTRIYMRRGDVRVEEDNNYGERVATDYYVRRGSDDSGYVYVRATRFGQSDEQVCDVRGDGETLEVGADEELIDVIRQQHRITLAQERRVENRGRW